MNLQDKVVVIIGGSQGFGRKLAEFCIAENAKVIIASKNKERIETTSQELGAIPFVADVRNEEELRSLAKSVIEKFGHIDIWINGAGVFMKFPKGQLLDMSRAHEMFDINFFGAVLGSRTALMNMKEGYIVNILSTSALDASRAVGAKLYASSKYALRGYVEALRGENKDSAVKILSIYPGGMKTHLHDEALPADFDNFMKTDYVAEKVITNLKLDSPEPDLIIKRPTA